MSGPLQEGSLPDGTVVRVDAKTAYALGMLQQIAERLARGGLDVLVVTWDGVEPQGSETHSFSYYNNPGRLVAVSTVLQSQSERLPKIASLWEGNMPGASRSFRTQ